MLKPPNSRKVENCEGLSDSIRIKDDQKSEHLNLEGNKIEQYKTYDYCKVSLQNC